MHDLSLKGLGFVSSVKLTVEMEFEEQLWRDGLPPVPALYRLKHHRALSRQLSAGGAEFIKVLPDSAGQIMFVGRVAKSRKKTQPTPAGATPNAA